MIQSTIIIKQLHGSEFCTYIKDAISQWNYPSVLRTWHIVRSNPNKGQHQRSQYNTCSTPPQSWPLHGWSRIDLYYGTWVVHHCPHGKHLSMKTYQILHRSYVWRWSSGSRKLLARRLVAELLGSFQGVWLFPILWINLHLSQYYSSKA